MRGSATERGQNRQQKLDGIVTWYFDYVMESLPLMLQAALLLLGCALSLYLWEINTVVASVILAVTSLGAIFYVFIVIAGTASANCPYQTPFSHILRYIFRHTLHYTRHNLLPTLRSAPTAVSAGFSNFFSIARNSITISVVITAWLTYEPPWYSTQNLGQYVSFPLVTSITLLVDFFFIMIRISIFMADFGRRVYQWSFGAVLNRWAVDTFPASHGVDQRTVILDLRCISWILQTSLEKSIRLATLEHLVSISEFGYSHPTLVLDCFNIFVGCVIVNDRKVTIMEGLEDVARTSAIGFFGLFLYLAIMDPTSTVLVDLLRQYRSIFLPNVDFTGLQFHSTMAEIRLLASRFGIPRYISERSHRMPGQEHTPFSRRIAEIALVKYQQAKGRKVPRWILRSALYLLSMGSLFPSSTVPDALMAIALDMGCDLPDTNLDERYVPIQRPFLTLLTLNQCTSGTTLEPHYPETRNGGGSRRSRRDILEAQGHQRAAPVRDVPGARGTPRNA